MSSLNIYASNNNSVSETYEQNHEVKKVPGERKILVQKVEIVFPPRRVSHYFNKSYQLDNHNNESTTYDNYCDTVPSTEIPSVYDDTVNTAISEATEPTVDDTLTNLDETKNTNLEQHSLDIPDTSINPTETILNPTNTLKFTSKCPENRSNNILPLKMKRIIRKPKIILRTSRFGRTQVLNAPQQLPVVESIPVNNDTTTRLDEEPEIQDIPVENGVIVDIPEKYYEPCDIQPQEQVPELVLGIKNEETAVEREVDLVEDIQSEFLNPPPNISNEEFYGFELDDKMDSEADVQIKCLGKVLENFNNFQDDADTTSKWIEPGISDITQAFTEPQPNEIQTKVLHNFTLKKDDIEKLDETLKVISLNLSSCAVAEDLELENMKLKLIVKHLMGKLQVNSLQETFEFDDEDVMDLTEGVVECTETIPLVTEEVIDATMHQEGL